MKEKDIQSLFTAYIKKNKPEKTMVWELKLVKGNSVAFNRIAPHQIDALLKAKSSNGIYWKIPDTAAISGFTSPKPYDCQFICNAEAYVCPVWYIPRKRKTMYLVKIEDWIHLEQTVDRKSATEEMVKLVADEIIEL